MKKVIRRVVSIFCGLCVMAGSAMGFVSCGGNDNPSQSTPPDTASAGSEDLIPEAECEHKEGIWKLIGDSTCAKEGERELICSGCGRTEIVAIAKKPHTPVTDKGMAATCTETGLSEGSHCSVCGEVITAQETLPMTEHTYVNGKCSACSAAEPKVTYTVTFKDYNGTVLSTQTVAKGSSATAPANPMRAGYTFTGWDKKFNNVTSNLTVTANYQQMSGALMVIDYVTAKAGGTVTVNIMLQNVGEVKSLAVSGVTYDPSVLTLTGGVWKTSSALIKDWNDTKQNGVAAFSSNTNCNGTILTLTFKVKSSAKAGTYAIGCTGVIKKMVNGTETNVAFKVVEGSITVK